MGIRFPTFPNDMHARDVIAALAFAPKISDFCQGEEAAYTDSACSAWIGRTFGTKLVSAVGCKTSEHHGGVWLDVGSSESSAEIRTCYRKATQKREKRREKTSLWTAFLEKTTSQLLVSPRQRQPPE